MNKWHVIGGAALLLWWLMRNRPIATVPASEMDSVPTGASAASSIAASNQAQALKQISITAKPTGAVSSVPMRTTYYSNGRPTGGAADSMMIKREDPGYHVTSPAYSNDSAVSYMPSPPPQPPPPPPPPPPIPPAPSLLDDVSFLPPSGPSASYNPMMPQDPRFRPLPPPDRPDGIPLLKPGDSVDMYRPTDIYGVPPANTIVRPADMYQPNVPIDLTASRQTINQRPYPSQTIESSVGPLTLPTTPTSSYAYSPLYNSLSGIRDKNRITVISGKPVIRPIIKRSDQGYWWRI